MLINYIFLILFFIFTIIITLVIIVDRYLEKKTNLKNKNKKKENDLIRDKENEREKMLWFIFADFVLNEKFHKEITSIYGCLTKNNIELNTYFYRRKEYKTLLREKFRKDGKKSILNFYNLKNVDNFNIMSQEEYDNIENDFMIYFFEVAKFSDLINMNFLKDKITDFQPERKNELEHFLKKIKLKNMFNP